jgi:PAS domain S-box-containing protein
MTAEPRTIESVVAEPARRTIALLLVSDDAQAHRVIGALVAEASGRTRLDRAATYADGLRTLLQRRHDAALVDARLGSASGLELVQQARAAGCRIPCILLSSAAGDDLALHAVRCGASDCLDKTRLDRSILDRTIGLAVERSRSVDALARSEERFRALVEHGAQVALVDAGGVFRYVSRAAARVVGTSVEGLLGTSILDRVHPADAAALDRSIARASGRRGRATPVDVRLRHADGSWRQIAGTLTSRLGEPAIDGLILSVRDAGRSRAGTLRGSRTPQDPLAGATAGWETRGAARTEDRFVEPRGVDATPLEREERFRAVFEGALDAMMIIDEQGALTDVNQAGCTLLNLPYQDIVGRRISELVPAEDQSLRAEAWERFLDEGHTSGVLELVRPGGERRIAEFRARSHVMPNRHLAILRDVTEQRQLEERLQLSQKIETVGRLAGGVAHDFNNLLTAILGYAELVLDRLEPGHELRPDLEEIRRAGERAASLTQQLLAFGRKQVLRPKTLDLNTIVAGMDGLLRRLIREDIRLSTSLHERLWSVEIDPGQIEQVIVNLVVNARDALAGGGGVTIETSNDLVSDEYARAHPPMRAGHYVRLTVADTGVGMDSDTLSHVFEPFFTTKERGKGTGLGLATVYGIVKQSGGFIWAESGPGEGSRFSIYLPTVERASEAPPASAAPRCVPRGTETVLLVEDEETVRSLAREVLKRNGYTVLEAQDAHEARRIDREHRGSIHLLLTDVVMPGLSGPELAAQIAGGRPGLRVLYMSGYTDGAPVGPSRGPGFPAFLPKPFMADTLASKVREVLDAAG